MNKKFLTRTKHIALVSGGTMVLAFAVGGLILPQKLVVGGVAGLSLCLAPLLPLSAEEILPILTWGLFFLGWAVFGHKFAAKTLLSSTLYPLGITLFSKLPLPAFSPLIAALFGGLLVGVGCAMTFLGGGSSGGIDVAALTLCKFIPRLKRARALFLLDALIILLGALILRNLILTALGILSAFTTALALDYILSAKKVS